MNIRSILGFISTKQDMIFKNSPYHNLLIFIGGSSRDPLLHTHHNN